MGSKNCNICHCILKLQAWYQQLSGLAQSREKAASVHMHSKVHKTREQWEQIILSIQFILNCMGCLTNGYLILINLWCLHVDHIMTRHHLVREIIPALSLMPYQPYCSCWPQLYQNTIVTAGPSSRNHPVKGTIWRWVIEMTAGVRKFDQVNYYGIVTAVPNATCDFTWNFLPLFTCI